ncbi:glycoside hydrolase family 36 protein [Aquimarina litoralis]|uniref:glycoside hydrolase family 36 protein n=1 Tax=Aquimarina litoralis TaxID=584605 RepID=UPI001C593CF4|nr:glycoside hydrolase family 36 protein [Aquimarina litoralis]MBW1295695.1 alpha-galactosidase [Aquimarina litoralis]
MNIHSITRIVAFCSIFHFLSCNNQDTSLTYKIPKENPVTPLSINLDSIKIDGELGDFSVSKKISSKTEGVHLITFTFLSDTPSSLQPVDIKFNFPSIDINGYWNTTTAVDKVNYYRSSVSSRISSNAPILCFYNNQLDNRITIALSDALNKSTIESYLKEEDVHFYPTIRLFEDRMPKTTSYSITLRIDTRKLPFHETVNSVATWWAQNPNYKPMFVPDEAKKPMYSTWYSYHQNISAEAIINECKIAKSLGCEAVIIDDGWQTNDNNRGYAYTGDWTPDRIPEMKKFVEAVHEQGMKFILWYSLPFIGEKSKAFPNFQGKYLRYWESQGTYVLDPRYPETREHIINTYEKALKEWNVDGFKLDFIGWFVAKSDTKLTKEDGRDFASVSDATERLMTDIMARLSLLKPNILIEFRQPYIGPIMRKYGNMFRGVDAPNNAVANRLEVTNLRILSQNTAVHSDMFIWRNEETPEVAALQILNILYSVPQLSVKLEEVPEEHLKMIRHWFSYWNKNREILLDGDFIPSSPVSNYPFLTAIKDRYQITTLYEDIPISLDSSIEKLDIINAKSTNSVFLKVNTPFKGKMIISDCFGTIVYENEVSFNEDIVELVVPKSGLLSFIKQL